MHVSKLNSIELSLLNVFPQVPPRLPQQQLANSARNVTVHARMDAKPRARTTIRFAAPHKRVRPRAP